MRTFVDQTGTEWTVWEVRPARHLGAARERRAGERRGAAAPDPIVERRRQDERRAGEGDGPWAPGVAAGLAQGWLTFDAGTQRRRLAPVPRAWEGLDDAELAALCRAAVPAAASGPAATSLPAHDGG